MTDLLEARSVLDDAAKPAPWFVRRSNDDACLGALAISTSPPDPDALFTPHWPAQGMAAACMPQFSGEVVPEDGRYAENAALIAALRNALPELIRLGRIGQTAERAHHAAS